MLIVYYQRWRGQLSIRDTFRVFSHHNFTVLYVRYTCIGGYFIYSSASEQSADILCYIYYIFQCSEARYWYVWDRLSYYGWWWGGRITWWLLKESDWSGYIHLTDPISRSPTTTSISQTRLPMAWVHFDHNNLIKLISIFLDIYHAFKKNFGFFKNLYVCLSYKYLLVVIMSPVSWGLHDTLVPLDSTYGSPGLPRKLKRS